MMPNFRVNTFMPKTVIIESFGNYILYISCSGLIYDSYSPSSFKIIGVDEL